MSAERIFEEAFSGETPAAPLQLIGLFALIYAMEKDEDPLTAAKLARFTGLANSQVLTHLKKLMERDLVERTPIASRHAKGRSLRISIKHNAKTRRLLDALESAPVTKRKPRSRK